MHLICRVYTAKRGSYRVTTTSLYTLTMLMELFQIYTDKPIKYDETYFPIQWKRA